MGFLNKIRRHAAVASGNFATIFKDLEIPPLPAAVSLLIAEINQPQPDIDKLEKLISSATGLAAKVIQTANSSLFGIRQPVTNIRYAVTILGLRNIRSLALAYSTMDALPKPKGNLFDHEAFWTDSLFQAIMCRSLSKDMFKDQTEEAFTASLLSDVALPVLLSVWKEYYEPVIEEWKQSPKRLSEIEREHFGWDHAQAGAWIAQSWGFPEEMVCCIGAHNLSWEKIHEYDLAETIVAPMAIAASSSSVLKIDPENSSRVIDAAEKKLSMTAPDFFQCMTEVGNSLEEILKLFGLSTRNVKGILDSLKDSTVSEKQRESL